MKPQIIVDGRWLSTLMPWGDLEWSTCWPGGTESITFGVARSHHSFRPGALVELDYGGIRLAAGVLVEPTRGEPLMAEGLHRKAEDFTALQDSALGPGLNVNDAVDYAIARGWRVTRAAGNDLSPEPGVRGLPRIDLNQPSSVAKYLDQSAIERGQGWGVLPNREVVIQGWPAPFFHMLPGIEGLARSRDGYASTLLAVYLSSVTSTFLRVPAEDSAARNRWGYVERIVTEPLGGGTAMTSAQALQILNGLLAQGRSQMGWASSIEAQLGDIVTEYGTPVAPWHISAGQVIRVHGLGHDVADLGGGTTANVRIARTHHKDSTVTIEPVALSQPMNDALAGVSG